MPTPLYPVPVFAHTGDHKIFQFVPSPFLVKTSANGGFFNGNSVNLHLPKPKAPWTPKLPFPQLHPEYEQQSGIGMELFPAEWLSMDATRSYHFRISHQWDPHRKGAYFTGTHSDDYIGKRLLGEAEIDLSVSSKNGFHNLLDSDVEAMCQIIRIGIAPRYKLTMPVAVRAAYSITGKSFDLEPQIGLAHEFAQGACSINGSWSYGKDGALVSLELIYKLSALKRSR